MPIFNEPINTEVFSNNVVVVEEPSLCCLRINLISTKKKIKTLRMKTTMFGKYSKKKRKNNGFYFLN